MKRSNKTIVLGSDHGGFQLKQKIKLWLENTNYAVIDMGSYRRLADDDYPLFALLTARRVAQAKNGSALGILFCRSGGGMTIVANKVKGIRAVEAFTPQMARYARQHNHSNILTLGQDFLSDSQIKAVIQTWLKTETSKHSRHQRRLRQIERAEHGQIEVTPGILEKSLAQVKKRINSVANYTSWLHIDLADNTLVPNTTFLNLAQMSQLKIKAKKELHLMVTKPLLYLKPALAGGFIRVIVQLETKNLPLTIKRIKKLKLQIGLAININTPVTRVKKYLRQVDLVLVMGVKAGFAAQQFRSEALNKVVKLKEWRPSLTVVVDGGVNPVTVVAVAAAGADRVIANSAIFSQDNKKKALEQLSNYGRN
ncbi:MAG: RpiB/LacA/LacB family sugar-phosphate isomerase [Patescibacteria group bacterium]